MPEEPDEVKIDHGGSRSGPEEVDMYGHKAALNTSGCFCGPEVESR